MIGLDSLLLNLAVVAGIVAQIGGDTPQQQVFRHYTNDANPADFANGLNPNSFATTADGPAMAAQQAQSSLSLENLPTVYYNVTIEAGAVPVDGSTTVDPIYDPFQPGGGTEFMFPEGTPPGSVTGPYPLPGGS